MLEDEKLKSGSSYVSCNFMVIQNKNKKNRIWERPNNADIINEANANNTLPAQREIT